MDKLFELFKKICCSQISVLKFPDLSVKRDDFPKSEKRSYPPHNDNLPYEPSQW